jgi:hypothetical protein
MEKGRQRDKTRGGRKRTRESAEKEEIKYTKISENEQRRRFKKEREKQKEEDNNKEGGKAFSYHVET